MFAVVSFYAIVSLIMLVELAPTWFVRLPIIDAETYHIWAIRISEGHLAAHEPFFLSPLYPFFLGIVYLIFGPNPEAGMAIQIVLGIGILLGVFELGARMFRPSVGMMSAIVLMVFGPFYYFANTLLSATLILFLNTLMLWLLWLFKDSEKAGRWLLIGIVGGLSALARPNVLIFLTLLILPLLVWQGRQAWKRWGWLWVGVAILVVPVIVRNTIVGRDLTLTTTTAGINIYIGNHFGSNGSYTEAPFVMSADAANEAEGYRLEAEARTGESLTAAAASRYWLGQALKDIAGHPGQYMLLLGRKVFLFFNRVEAPTNISYYGAQVYSSLLRAFRVDMGLLIPLGLAGLVLSIRRAREYLVFYVYFFSYLLANLVFFVASEYRFPVVAVLVVFAGVFLMDIFKLFRERRAGWIILGVLAYFGCLGMTNHHTEFTRSLASARMDFFNLGSTLVKWGNSMDSIVLFQKTLVEDPDFKEAHEQLGWSYLDIGETQLAEEEFQLAGVPMPFRKGVSRRDSLLNQSNQQVEAEDFRGAIETLEELVAEWETVPFWIYQELAGLSEIVGDLERMRKYQRLVKEGRSVNY